MSGSSAVAPKASLAAVGAINAVLPRPVMTSRRHSLLNRFTAGAERFARETGISRYGQPEDVAALIAFLLSPPARWMTGATLCMDGSKIEAI